MTALLTDSGHHAVAGMMSDAEHAMYRAFILREAGIEMSDMKRALLVSRLSSRVRKLCCDTFEDYLEHVKEDAAERVRMLDLITTNETRFFREPDQFEFLEETAIPRWKNDAAAGKRNRTLRVWSAACSSGEEPYSFAMLLLSHLGGWRVEILATDLSTRVLDVARAGEWPIERTRHIPGPFLRRYMLRGTGSRDGKAIAHPQLKKMIHVRRLNLISEIDSVEGTFDLVLCRNAMMYFDHETRCRVVDALVSRTEPGGYLFVGHAETLHGVSNRVASIKRTIWTRKA